MRPAVPRTLRSRSEDDLAAQPPEHLHALRCRRSREPGKAGAGRRFATWSWNFSKGRRSPRGSTKAPLPLPTPCARSRHPQRSRGGSPAGIVHRDLKPGNVMLTNPARNCSTSAWQNIDRRGGTRSTRWRRHPTAGQRHSPRSGTILGTFQYMAPEQMEGEGRTRAGTLRVRSGALQDDHRPPPFTGKTRRSLVGAISERRSAAAEPDAGGRAPGARPSRPHVPGERSGRVVTRRLTTPRSS